MPASAAARRALLADTAIDVLAEHGMRGLTHRAVDRAAGLPPGTTSAYHRTRQSLLTALVSRLVERDQVEIQEAGRQAGAPRDAGELVAGLTAFAALRLTGEGRRRSLARYACALESVHHPELREILAPRDNAARRSVEEFLAARGLEDARERTITLLTCVDGLVFDRLVNGGAVPAEEVRRLVEAALRQG
ncbi:TetR/AcrR family transcriptional regulator [Streptomyces sp. NPDC020472]|uniref:TetR/AcrR family transcriptional regulator n=1 Tax=Streptomyces sp. NPDC020472 TaxID=3365075 RepID=UPI00379068CD